MIKPNYVFIPFVTVLVSVFGSYLTSLGIDSGWYGSIAKPEWTPDGSVIGLVWTTIFILTTIAALLTWNRAMMANRRLWIAFAFLLNGALNVAWTYIFFTRHWFDLAVVEAVALEISVLVLIILVRPLSKFASYLLLPYAGWVLFAAYLTFDIWLLNR